MLVLDGSSEEADAEGAEADALFFKLKKTKHAPAKQQARRIFSHVAMVCP